MRNQKRRAMKLYREKMAKKAEAKLENLVPVPVLEAKVESSTVKTLPKKKAPKPTRVCSVCKEPGHTKRSCPTLKTASKEIEVEETIEEDPSKKWWQNSKKEE